MVLCQFLGRDGAVDGGDDRAVRHAQPPKVSPLANMLISL